MPITLPRREKAAPKHGPRLEISPLELGEHLQTQHGLTALLTNAESWEQFCWKGNELSAPLRALYVAETRGLLTRRGDRANDVLIADIAADINSYLLSVGKSPVTENSVLSNLSKAAFYVSAAFGVSIVPDRRAMSIRLVDAYETAENMAKWVQGISVRLKKINGQVDHARSCGFEDQVSHILTPAQMDAVKALAPAN